MDREVWPHEPDQNQCATARGKSQDGEQGLPRLRSDPRCRLSRGTLRVYVGAVVGGGKIYRMLVEAHHLCTDVDRIS
jgi:hypothetical protein